MRGGGFPTGMICGSFLFDARGAGVLPAMLPPFMHLKGVNGRAEPWLAETLRLMMEESDSRKPRLPIYLIIIGILAGIAIFSKRRNKYPIVLIPKKTSNFKQCV
jgi:hypothetical protein